MFYTQRRANMTKLKSVEYCYGTAIGIATSKNNGVTWEYSGVLSLPQPDDGKRRGLWSSLNPFSRLLLINIAFSCTCMPLSFSLFLLWTAAALVRTATHLAYRAGTGAILCLLASGKHSHRSCWMTRSRPHFDDWRRWQGSW